MILDSGHIIVSRPICHISLPRYSSRLTRTHDVSVPQLKYKRVERVRHAAKALREIGETFVRDTYEKMNSGSPLPDAMFSYVLQEIKEAGTSLVVTLQSYDNHLFFPVSFFVF